MWNTWPPKPNSKFEHMDLGNIDGGVLEWPVGVLLRPYLEIISGILHFNFEV